MARLDKTLADYIAIAISPVLIMLMVGSLMYFLVAVTYVGRYDERIYWILSCYTLAIVLIARISIEEGQERAFLFGAALAIVTGLAVSCFSNHKLAPWLILGLVWWAAHKLTWDCTLIDEDQDSSGQGLLRRIGLRRRKEEDDRDAEDAEPSPDKSAKVPKAEQAEPEGVTARVSEMRAGAHPRRAPKGKAHAPGVWIVYFSLAALPLFGLGQLLIPAGDVERRRWAFQLLCVYVASGLGLLLTTSFLGLRRYLRQRDIEMPSEMAGVWIALGAALIVALLVVAALLPRPAAEYAISQFPITFTTPERSSSRYALGNDGADRNEPDSPATTQEDQGQETAQEDEACKQEDAQQSESPQQEGPPSRQKGESSRKQGESSQQKESQQDEASQRQEPSDQADPSERPPEDEGKAGSSETSESASDKQEEPSGKQSDRRPSDSQGSQRDASEHRQDQKRDSEPNEEDAKESRQHEQEPQSSQAAPQRRQDAKEPGSTRSGGRPPAPKPPKPQPPREPWFRLPRVSLSLGGLVKLILYALLLGVVGYGLWKSRERLSAAFQQSLRDLREFWARLFGRKQARGEETAGEAAPEPMKLRPFADYVDPFVSGRAGRLAPDELVRYTFEALGAWARENGCPRLPEQTPGEFARQVGSQAGDLAAGAQVLADLYCRVAYAPGHLDARSTEPLRQFWQRLRTARRGGEEVASSS